MPSEGVAIVMTEPEEWTVKKLLEWTTEYFTKNGSESSRLDAEILLSHVLNWSRIQLYTEFEFQPDGTERSQFRELIKRRAAGVPVAYLIGTKEFYSMDFLVTPDVLIPRPETEFAVVRSLDLLRNLGNSGEPLRCLDLCTGSGAIGIALAAQEPRLHVTASDISRPALAIARENVQRHQLEDRVQLLESDLFGAIPTRPFHLIVSNPPYIGLQEEKSLSSDVVDHEPRVALFSGQDGCDCSLAIIRQAPDFLAPHGWLVMESSPFVIDQLAATVESDPRFQSPIIDRDLAGHKRILSAQVSNDHQAV